MSKQAFLLLFLSILVLLRFLTFCKPAYPIGTRIKLIATLKQEPKTTPYSQILQFSSLRARIPAYPEYHYGDRLLVVGTVSEGNELVGVEKVEKLGEEESLGKFFLNLKRRIEGIYQKSLPEPQASLLSGIVLGSKSNLPADFYDNLRLTGTLHIVVASGMNITIIASVLTSLFLLVFPRSIALFFAFLGIWAYVLLAGGEIPVVRAGIMGSLVFLAQGLGREADAWRSLFLAGLLFLLLNPNNISDLGFQLSFTATGGILFFGSRISKLLERAPNFLKTNLSQTLGAQIATLPIILIHFGQFSPLSPLANLLVVEILPLIMQIGLIVALVGLIFPSLAHILAWITYPLLTYFVEVVSLFGGK